jgi:hypothetical protein
MQSPRGHVARGETETDVSVESPDRLTERATVKSLLKHDVIRGYAELFLAVVGILYGTGFLTAFTFLERFGIRETGSELLKLKYIYVGILYFLFPVTVMLPALALGSLWSQSKKNERQKLPNILRGRAVRTPVRMSFVTILLFINMALVFYIFICFAPVTFMDKRPWVTAAVSVPTILGALLFRFLEVRRLRRRLVRVSLLKRPLLRFLDSSRTLRRRFRSREYTSRAPLKWWRKVGAGRTVLFLLIVALVDRPSLHGLWGDLKLMFWGDESSILVTIYGFDVGVPIGGFNYFLFVFLYVLIGQRVYKRMKEHASAARTKYVLAASGLCASLFIVSVLSFAIRVYPFIPALKGGGDYRRTAATIQLKAPGQHGLVVPESVVIIEETDASLFIALPREKPVKTQENIRAEGEWRSWKNLPAVLEIPRDQVAYVYYWPPGKKAADSAPRR